MVLSINLAWLLVRRSALMRLLQLVPQYAHPSCLHDELLLLAQVVGQLLICRLRSTEPRIEGVTAATSSSSSPSRSDSTGPISLSLRLRLAGRASPGWSQMYCNGCASSKMSMYVAAVARTMLSAFLGGFVAMMLSVRRSCPATTRREQSRNARKTFIVKSCTW
jgi:hypothetical protein